MSPMIELTDDSLTWVFAAPLAAALALFAFARAPLLWTRLLVALVVQAGALTASVLLGARLLRRGGFALFDVDGWVGARLVGSDPTGLLSVELTAGLLPLLVAVEVAGLLALGLLSQRARSAGSSAPSAAVLFASAMCSLLVIAKDTEAICAAFSLSGLAGFALLVCFHPRRQEVEGAMRAFILHRTGDALLLAAVVVIGAGGFRELGSAGALDAQTLAATMTSLDPWQRASAGPWQGFAAREVWSLAGALIAAAAATRLVGVPLARDAVGAPGPALGLAHGVCFAGAGLILLVRAAPLLWLAPEVLTGLGLAGALVALIAALLAASSRDIVRIDILLLGGLASIGAVAAAATDLPTLSLAVVLLVVAAVPLCTASGAIVEATGRADPHSLGGLEQAMPRTHTTRLLAGGALFGPVFAGAAVGAHVLASSLSAPWLGPPVAITIALALFTLALAAFRPLHLVFTGKEPKEPLAHKASDPPPLRTIPALAVALPLLGLGLAHLPPGALATLPNVERYRSPLAVLLLPERALFEPLRLHVLPPLSSPSLPPLAVLALAVAALTLGWLVSTVVYRGGVGRLHRTLVGGRRARTVVAIVAGVAGGENQVVRGVGEGAIRLSRMIATNLAPGVLDTLLRRLPSLFGFVVGFVVRLIANGSAQRGIVVAVIVLIALLWSLGVGGLPGQGGPP